MLFNYIKIAIRNLYKYKFYSLINIIGLSIGLSCTILISLFVFDELNYDKHHEKTDRIYRSINHIKFGGNDSWYAVSAAPLSKAMMEEIPEIEVTTRFRNWGSFLIKREGEDNIKEHDVIWAETEVFEVFTIPLLKGDNKTALNDPNTMVVSKSFAEKYFGNDDPINQILILENEYTYKITGVFEDMPTQSHFHFNVMLSMEGLEESKNQIWLSNNFITYFVMQKNADPEVVEKKINELFLKYAGPQVLQFMGKSMVEFEEQGNKAELFIQPIQDIHLHSDLIGEMEPNSDIKYIYIFSAVAIFILILACVNFMNLATARSSNRAKEVGIRKVLGSLRIYLIRQFLTESILITAVSILIAIMVSLMALPLFNSIAGKNINIPIFDPVFWIITISGTLIIGILAGIYPAFFISSFKPSTILHGKASKGSKSGFIRNFLVVFQFATSIILIIGTAAVFNQLNYIQDKKLGFQKDQIIILDDAFVLNEQIESFKNEMLRNPDILAATVSSFLPVSNSSRNNTSLWKKGSRTMENTVSMQQWRVDHDYINTLGMKIIQGRAFSKEFPSDSSGIIINEKAARLYGFEDPIGMEVQTFRSNPDNSIDEDNPVIYKVIGVVEDFHFESLKENIGALSMVLKPSSGKISFRFKAGKTTDVLNSLENKWKEFANGQPFQYSFLDEEFGQMYQDEKRVSKIFTSFAILAIIIASLGLFALASFTTEQRTKEIGVRKVMGASVSSILILLSKDFSKLVVIAFILALPIAWYIVNLWLESFAYKDIPGAYIYVAAGFSALLLAWLTVSYQSFKAAIANPVKSLRDE